MPRGTPVPWSDVDPILGLFKDSELAKKFGITEQTIRCRRHKLGIAAWREAPGSRPCNPYYTRKWSPDFDKLLGTKSDAEIARNLRLSTSCVAGRRRRLGIPAYQRPQFETDHRDRPARGDQP